MVFEVRDASSATNNNSLGGDSGGGRWRSANGGGGGGGGGLGPVAAGGRMPYVFVRENAIKYWCTVQGLNHNEVRVLSEKVTISSNLDVSYIT